MSKVIVGLEEKTHQRFKIYTIKTGAKNAEEALKALLDAHENEAVSHE